MLIILAWVALTLVVSFGVPWLETVGRQHSVPLAPHDAPAVQAMQRMGSDFKESDSDSFAMLLIEGQQPLGDDAHTYYDGLIRALRSDTKHVEHIQDLWGDRLTAAGAQSADGKAVYAQLNLAGNQGTTLGQDSIAAVRNIVAQTPPPPGLKVYVTGPAALASDMQHAGDRSILKMTVIGAVIIFVVLLLVYRSVVTVVVLLITVGIELFAARGIVAFLADHNVVVLSTFAINLLVALAMAAGTDYGIFFFGRYQEARQAGEDRETAYYSTYRGVAPVVLGSGLTIAGAMLCLSFTRLPIFQTIGVPCAVGMLVAVAVAITLVPAVLTVGSRFGLFEPKRAIGFRRWRRVGTAIVRWPAPILVATMTVALLGLAALPGYKTSYNDRQYIPPDIPANVGYTAAERHFSQARLMPEILMIESDHDMRNPADFIVLHKIAKAIFRVPGISRVQGITRPEGTPIEHTSIPFLMSLQNAAQAQSMKFMQGSGRSHGQGDRADGQADHAHEAHVRLAEAARRHHSPHDRADKGNASHHERAARRCRDFRRFLQAHPQLLLLGTALLRHSDLLVAAKRLRHARRRRHAHRQDAGTPAVPGQDGRSAATTSRADAAADRDHGVDADHDADDARHHVGHAWT